MPRWTQPTISGLMGFIPRAKVTKVKGRKFATSGKKANATPTSILRIDFKARTAKVRKANRKAG